MSNFGVGSWLKINGYFFTFKPRNYQLIFMTLQLDMVDISKISLSQHT